MFQTKFLEKIKTHFMLNNFFSPKIMPFMRYVEKYGRARQATYDSIIRRVHFAYWITKARNTHAGNAVAQLIEALRYKPERRGFDSR
jgi:hypothetical protein